MLQNHVSILAKSLIISFQYNIEIIYFFYSNSVHWLFVLKLQSRISGFLPERLFYSVTLLGVVHKRYEETLHVSAHSKIIFSYSYVLLTVHLGIFV
jgi:hypothetical protein